MAGLSRRKVLILSGLAAAAVAAGGALIYSAMSENVVFFYSPTQVAEGKAPQNHTFRVGGMVKKGSVETASDGLTTRFVVTDDA
ncbi:MAG: cytochrome c maturation protein CcmE, partial [Sutterellaceae bacterium]|nr:cytochrome c maturation protein CcmE [Sutterellaceae bacterium]